jgi:3-oxoacyl-[acyl-carrier-protein] synthase-3
MTTPTADAAVLCGLGSWLPPVIVPNAEIADRLGVSDEWIRQRVGVRERRRAEPGTATVAMAVEAGARALKSQGYADVDAVLLATNTPDRLGPAGAPEVAAKLGLSGVAAVDLAAACSGFVYGLSMAAAYVRAGTFERVLVIGSETMSAMLDPDDPDTAPIFADGAGAAVVRAGRADEPGALGPFVLGSDGDRAHLVQVPDGGALTRYRPTERNPRAYIQMDGTQVFKQALEHMGTAARRAAELAGWSLADVDRFATHQANARISAALARRLGVPADRCLSNIEYVGNTSGASVPLLLDHANADGSLLPGHRVVLAAFGAGLAWGATTLVWPELRSGE